jgi:hypothetical protein
MNPSAPVTSTLVLSRPLRTASPVSIADRRYSTGRIVDSDIADFPLRPPTSVELHHGSNTAGFLQQF